MVSRPRHYSGPCFPLYPRKRTFVGPEASAPNILEPPGASSVSGARGGCPSTKSDPSHGKIRIFFKLAVGQTVISRQLSSTRAADALSPAFFQEKEKPDGCCY